MDGYNQSVPPEWDSLAHHCQDWGNSAVCRSDDHDYLLGVGGVEDTWADFPLPPDLALLDPATFACEQPDFTEQGSSGPSSLGLGTSNYDSNFLPINGDGGFIYSQPHHDLGPFNHVDVLENSGQRGLVAERLSDQHPGGIPIPQAPRTASTLSTEPSLLYGSSFTSSQHSAFSFEHLYNASLRERSQTHLVPPSPLSQTTSAWSSPENGRVVWPQAPNNNTFDAGHTVSPPHENLNDLNPPTFDFVLLPDRPETVRPEVERARRARGRKGPLNEEQRRHAAELRKIGACQNCRRRKFKCDPGVPCQSCLKYYGSELINFPCRNWHLNDISSSLLTDIRSWHPRSLDSLLDFYLLDPTVYELNIRLGRGPPVAVQVRMIDAYPTRPILHEHLVYPWPPRSDQAAPAMHTHNVFPAIAVNQIRLRFTLDQYLSDLVDNPTYIHSFPVFRSRLQVFEHVYNFYRSLDKSSPHHSLLHNALKLLVLVHVGDVTELDPTTPYDPSFAHFMSDDGIASASGASTPCFIRSQLGAAVPALASALLLRTLTLLYETSLPQRHDAFPVVMATVAVVLMARESVQYHAARLAFHACHDDYFAADADAAEMQATVVFAAGSSQQHTQQPVFGPAPPPVKASGTPSDDPKPDPIDRLLSFYRACYGRAHAAHFPLIATRDRHSSSSTSRQTSQRHPPLFADASNQRFVDALRQVLAGDETAWYVRERVGIGVSDDGVSNDGERDGRGMAGFFDRLLGRLFVGDGETEVQRRWTDRK
ncbi:hypothetical protein IWX90DRAFT_120700 [Phyllosticta citrichinensis]|uniref:Zn(2)-C6 fungal-type domain-containing protein n=1 Tax=Phyllosticta citrichinensis TaxID=1130410 RepID=A0ABR1Y493_9PEZI